MMNPNRANLPRHKLEELKRKEDEQRTKDILHEFVSSFEDAPARPGTKTFIRGGVVNPEAGMDKSKPVGKLYKPPPSVAGKTADAPFEAAKKAAEERAKKIMDEVHRSKHKQAIKKQTHSSHKPKSNLEQFKDELRAIQEARDERRKIRAQLQEQLGTGSDVVDRIAPSLDNPYMNTFDHDPNTTNLFLSNLAPETTERSLCETFGKYGPLASVKIMYPRTEEEKLRGYFCGFIAFMTRIDADRAVLGLKGKPVLGLEMKMGWAKCINIPPHPVYVPPAMLELTLPPPPSGLPFNAQARPEDRQGYKWPIPPPGAPPPSDMAQAEAWNKMIRNAVVKVVMPTDRTLLCLIHRMIEFVVKEGPMFEAMIMSREMNNPSFRFLFDNHIPAHVYYRWKLFSLLQGDSPTKWRTSDFRMFEEGSLWRPPSEDFFQQGMPKELYHLADDALQHAANSQRSRSRSRSSSKSDSRAGSQSPEDRSSGPKVIAGQLTDDQRDRLEDILRGLTPERNKIAEAMIFCLENADCAEEVVQCIAESLSILETPLHKKIARVYLVSDILANCAAKVQNVTYYRKFIGEKLEEMMGYVHECYRKIEARLKAEQFKQRISGCFRSWEDTAIYPTEFLIRLQNIFFGLNATEIAQIGPEHADDDDLDGVPLPINQEYSSTETNQTLVKTEMDIDGVAIEESDRLSGTESNGSDRKSNQSKHSSSNPRSSGFKQSKWETVDPDLVEKQAVTSSKWEEVGEKKHKPSLVGEYDSDDDADDDDDDDIDGIPMDTQISKLRPTTSTSLSTNIAKKPEMDEDRRQKLREVEVMVMKYQDDLDCDVIKPELGLSISESVAKYRKKLMNQAEADLNLKQEEEGEISSKESSKHKEEKRDRKRSRSREREKDRHKKKKKRSKSRSRSRSPKRKHSRSKRSPSPSARHRRKRS